VKLTARAQRLSRDPLGTVWRRRFNLGAVPPRPKSDVAAQLAASPIVAVALDVGEGAEALNDTIRVTAERVLSTSPSARLACVNVLKLNRLAIDRSHDEQGQNKHVDRLVTLQHWARPFGLEEGRLTVHVLEAIDPAAAILEFAAVNLVDHIIIGARQNSLRRALLGSVSARVAGEASCTVTVVRPSRLASQADDGEGGEAADQAANAAVTPPALF
jgi:nucleotide-binding universal stress UspA family protein